MADACDHVSIPLDRALTTARLAGHPTPAIDQNLLERDDGEHQGLTATSIRHERPEWNSTGGSARNERSTSGTIART